MKFIRLTEYTRNNDELVKRAILINPEGIASIAEKRMERRDIPILLDGNNEVGVREVVMRNGRSHHVANEMDEIEQMVLAATEPRCREGAAA